MRLSVLQTCQPGEMLLTNHAQREWACWDQNSPPPIRNADQLEDQNLSNRQGPPIIICPPNGYTTCPNVEIDLPPSTVPTTNPLGLCHCENEIWVADGCRYGWQCGDDPHNSNGQYWECPEVS